MEADKGPAPPQHLQKKVLRRVRFLEKVAASRPALAPRSGGTHKKRKRQKAVSASQLPDLSTLVASLADAEREVEREAAAPRKGLGAGGSKARSRIMISETKRLQQVPLQSPKCIAIQSLMSDCTWYYSEVETCGSVVHLGLFNRKS